MNIKELESQLNALLHAHQVIKEIIALTEERKGEWQTETDIDHLTVQVERCLEPEIKIRLSLNSAADRIAGTAKEKRQAAEYNAKAKAFTRRILEHFKVMAKRGSEPQTLHVQLSKQTQLEIWHYPTGVTFKCEKQCVAVLPNGNTVPIEEVPIEM